MKQALTISLVLANFDAIRVAGYSNAKDFTGLLFFSIGADTRAAITAPDSQQSFKFVLVGIHEDEASANNFIANKEAVSPWLKEAKKHGVPYYNLFIIRVRPII